MNNSIRDINCLHNSSIYYGDTDSIYLEKKYSVVLVRAGLVGSYLGQGKNECLSGGIIYTMYLAPKVKYCLTIDKFGIIEEHKSFKRFNDSKRLIDRSQNFKILKAEKYQLS